MMTHTQSQQLSSALDALGRQAQHVASILASMNQPELGHDSSRIKTARGKFTTYGAELVKKDISSGLGVMELSRKYAISPTAASIRRRKVLGLR